MFFCVRQVHIWDVKTWSIQHRLTGHRNNVTACDFSPDGALLATASYDSRVIIWDTQSGAALFFLEWVSAHLFSATCSLYDGSRLFTLLLQVLESPWIFWSRFSRPGMSLKTDMVLESAWIWFSKMPWPNQLILKKVFHMASFWAQMC